MNDEPISRMMGFFIGVDIMGKEHAIQNAGRNALAVDDVFCTRANVGKAWTGNRDDITRLPDGSILIRNPRPFDTGLPTGFSDTFGVRSERVTLEWCQRMMGKNVGIAFFIEYKDIGKKPTPTQAAFLGAMSRLGARSGVATSADEAVAIAMGNIS